MKIIALWTNMVETSRFGDHRVTLLAGLLVFGVLAIYVGLKFQTMNNHAGPASSASQAVQLRGGLSVSSISPQSALNAKDLYKNRKGENTLFIDPNGSVLGLSTAPNPLREMVADATKRGLEQKTVFPRAISAPRPIPMLHSQVGKFWFDIVVFFIEFLLLFVTFQWLVSYYAGPAPSHPTSALAPGEPVPDPLDPTSDSAKSNVIAHISPGYTAILNKFNTITDHSLLVTDEFMQQNLLLRSSDLLAWYSSFFLLNMMSAWILMVAFSRYFCLQSIDGVGFYNSDKEAGASQKHKHMQFLPLDVIGQQRKASVPATTVIYEDLPVSVMFYSYILQSHWLPYDPYQLG
jgi:hypothetical protein